MGCNRIFIRLRNVSLGILLATSGASVAFATDYTFNTQTTGSANWHDSTKWNPAGIPNGTADTAKFVMPVTTGPAGNGFTLNIATTDTTVSAITVDNTGNPNNFVTRVNSTGGRMIFDTGNPLVAATYTENAGTPNTTNNGRFLINQSAVVLNSSLVVTQDNQPGLNTATEFAGRIDGDSNRMFTMNGLSSIQLSSDQTTGFSTGQGYFGQYTINTGGIRLIGREPILFASGFTVNSGGQLQLGIATTWDMASGSLFLNGTGKASGTTTAGALRFNGAGSSTFNPPVVLQSNARIDAATATTPATLAGVVSGSGGLIVSSNNNTGKLILSNANNSYTGSTQLLTGTLSLSFPKLFDGADVFLPAETSTARMDLNFGSFSTQDTVRSLYFNGVAQASGTWGPPGSGAAHESVLFTGLGELNVLQKPPSADFNGNGFVDAADYVQWRKGGPLLNEVSTPGTVDDQDYVDWREGFGNVATASDGGLGAAAVPEPSTLILLLFIAPLFVGRNFGRK